MCCRRPCAAPLSRLSRAVWLLACLRAFLALWDSFFSVCLVALSWLHFFLLLALFGNVDDLLHSQSSFLWLPPSRLFLYHNSCHRPLKCFLSSSSSHSLLPPPPLCRRPPPHLSLLPPPPPYLSLSLSCCNGLESLSVSLSNPSSVCLPVVRFLSSTTQRCVNLIIFLQDCFCL